MPCSPQAIRHHTLSPVHLHLPSPLAASIWKYAEQEAPKECVGALGGLWHSDLEASAHTFYPLPNLAAHPEREYLADPGFLLRAFRSMQTEGLSLVAFLHSHPNGPAQPSLTDIRLATYPVPYVIADLPHRRLHAYLLPSAEVVDVLIGD